MFSKKTDACLNNKNVLRCVFILALAVAMTAGATLYSALTTLAHSTIAAALSPLVLALVLILVLLLAAFYLARKISACATGMSALVAHCKQTNVDTLSKPFASEHRCRELHPLFDAYNKMLERLSESTSRIR